MLYVHVPTACPFCWSISMLNMDMGTGIKLNTDTETDIQTDMEKT